jgi:hypothetical protein
VRTWSEQNYLDQTLPEGQAANPNYVNQYTGRVGSAHQGQPSPWRYPGRHNPIFAAPPAGYGWGYAVDVGWWNPGAADWPLLRAVMADHGLVMTVFTPWEPWHFELDIDIPEGHFRPEPEEDIVAELPTLQPGPVPPRHRDSLKSLRGMLRERGIDPGDNPDHYGPVLRRAVIEFQGRRGLEPDGIVGPSTWRALLGIGK